MTIDRPPTPKVRRPKSPRVVKVMRDRVKAANSCLKLASVRAGRASKKTVDFHAPCMIRYHGNDPPILIHEI